MVRELRSCGALPVQSEISRANRFSYSTRLPCSCKRRKEMMKAGNRWVIAIAGVFLQIALGAVYAWSVFRIPLSKQFGWSISEVTFTFTISIFVLVFAAFFFVLWMTRKGPRILSLPLTLPYCLAV